MENTLDEKIFELALETAQKQQNVDYVDVKYLQRSTESLVVKNDILEDYSQSLNSGIGVRILINGAWGFAATNILDNSKIKEITEKAVRIARASSNVRKHRVKLAKEDVHVDTWHTPFKTDPSSVPVEEKVSLLIDSTKNANINDSRIKVRNAYFNTWKDKLILWTSEGTKINQTIMVVGGGVSSVVVDAGEAHTRSAPASFRGDFVTAGFEYIKEIDLISSAKKASEEAIQLIDARKCPSTETSVILHPNQLMLQLHESCGHPCELDRANDEEAAYAGTSFLKPNLLGKDFYYANEHITIVADATTPRGLGTFGYDHEGVKAQRTILIDKGKFVNYLSSRETATQLGFKRSSGAMRADVWEHIPLIRMTNISLEPGDWEYDELIADTKQGIIMDANKSWSIDDLRLNFQFSTEIGWWVENGEIKHAIKAPSYQGITPKFWGSCSGVTKSKYWRIMGTPNCGKGEPSQIMYTGHGSSPARFDHVKVGIVQL